MRTHYPGQYYDNNAELAKAGNVNEVLLLDMQSNKFFSAPYPKTTGPELFSLQYLQLAQKKTGTENISAADCMATLSKFTANMIVKGIREGINDTSNLTIISSGGGVHNPLLMHHLENDLNECTFQHATELGIDPDAKEAVLFALLANECISGNAEFIKTGMPGIPAIGMGKISFPH
jgi:anhydro-N-acetylmuramic acid kinase